MSSSRFLKLFPPPKLLLTPRIGIDASNDAIRIVSYREWGGRTEVAFAETVALAPSVIQGGDVSDEATFIQTLSGLAHAHKISYARVAIPEEKAYLFQTVVPEKDAAAVVQNIEFKIESNVPLTASEAAFDFDMFETDQVRASVSVVSKSYIEKQLRLYAAAGITVVGFETVPHAVARAVVPAAATGTRLIIHVMPTKTGLYIVSGTVVVFTSTVPCGLAGAVVDIAREVERVYSYWSSQDAARGEWVKEVLLVGIGSDSVEDDLRSSLGISIPMSVPHVWGNILDMHGYVPRMSQTESLAYAAAAGVAM